MNVLYTLACLVVAAECAALVWSITPKRTYYPLLRWIFGVWAGVYFAGAVGALTYSGQGDPRARLLGVLITAVALGWALVFVRRRNRVAQYIPTDYRGHPLPVDYDGVELSLLVARSYVAHGEATPEEVDGLREAIANYDRITRWKRDMARLAEARRRRRGVE